MWFRSLVLHAAEIFTTDLAHAHEEVILYVSVQLSTFKISTTLPLICKFRPAPDASGEGSIVFAGVPGSCWVAKDCGRGVPNPCFGDSSDLFLGSTMPFVRRPATPYEWDSGIWHRNDAWHSRDLN